MTPSDFIKAGFRVVALIVKMPGSDEQVVIELPGYDPTVIQAPNAPPPLPPNLNEPLGARMRRQRRRCGLSLGELAMLARVSKSYISLLERGEAGCVPSDEVVTRIERVLNFDDGELLKEAHLMRTPLKLRVAMQQRTGT